MDYIPPTQRVYTIDDDDVDYIPTSGTKNYNTPLIKREVVKKKSSHYDPYIPDEPFERPDPFEDPMYKRIKKEVEEMD